MSHGVGTDHLFWSIAKQVQDHRLVAGDVMERVGPIFSADPMTAAMKALGMT
jgi:hypothetical protein